MRIFKLPDLGEGLQDAEISAWHVRVGEHIEADQPLLSVETAKALVEIPSPRSGCISRLYAEAGDVVRVGDPLMEFDDGGESGPAPVRRDTGSVVGELKQGHARVREPAGRLSSNAAAYRATPAVRALARRLGVDLDVVTPTGPDGLITAGDVQRVAKILQEVGPMEVLRGVRRSMARTMSHAHLEVMNVTLMDEVDVHDWSPDTEPMLRLIRAVVAACRTEPALNAWYDSHALGRRLRDSIDLGIAMDTPDGLFVPVLQDVGNCDPETLRQRLTALKAAVRGRAVPPEQLRGQTFTLSNFGNLAGRFATPVVVPPQVAILGVGRVREAVVPRDGSPAVRRVMPLSLSFDHRCVTGGEAARFLAAAMAELSTPH